MPKNKNAAPDDENVTQTNDETVETKKTAPENSRQAAIDAIAEKVSARHRDEQQKAIDEGLAAKTDEQDPEEGADAPAAEAEEQEEAGAAPEVEDPLSGFAVIKDGKPVVKLKVDGQERFIPLEQARAVLSKNEAADARLREAARQRQEIEARERALQAREAEVNARAQKLGTQPPDTDAGDPDLKTEAKKLANKLLTGTEDEVAETLVTVLTPRQAKAPVVDPKAIAKEVRQELTAEQAQEKLVESLKKFEEDFEDIAKDPVLYAAADVISDQVKAENPTWTTDQILSETGKRTRERFGQPRPAVTTTATVNRQERKNNLRPLPQARVAAQAKPTEERPMTPAEVVREQRRARGQAV
jgi:hypothetical protein